MIFTIVAFFIMISSFFNYKEAFFVFLSYKLILVQNITIISIPGVPLLTVDTMLTLWFALLYFLEGSKYSINVKPMPYGLPLIIFCIVWFLSSIVSIAGFGAEITRYIQDILNNVVVVFLIWRLVETKEDYCKLFKWFTLVLFITVIYGFAEFIMKSNPLQQYEQTIIGNSERLVDNSYDLKYRGYRVSSVFSHSIGAGITWALYVLTVVDLKVKYNIKKLPWQNFSVLTVICCVVCIFLTKMRSPLIFLGVGLLSVVDFRKKSFYKFLIFILITLIIIFPWISKLNLTVLYSLFNSTAATQVSGSSLQQRTGQFQSAFQLLQYSPILGLGSKFQDVMVNSSLVQSLLGLESIWLNDILKYGILGVIADVIWLYYLLIKVPKYYHSSSAFWLSLAYAITITITSTPGFQIYLLYLVLFAFFKFSDRYKGFLTTKGANNG